MIAHQKKVKIYVNLKKYWQDFDAEIYKLEQRPSHLVSELVGVFVIVITCLKNSSQHQVFHS